MLVCTPEGYISMIHDLAYYPLSVDKAGKCPIDQGQWAIMCCPGYMNSFKGCKNVGTTYDLVVLYVHDLFIEQGVFTHTWVDD